MASPKICSGCKLTLPAKEFMVCSKCKSKYDLMCANLTLKRFTSMESRQKSSWKCPECCSYIPKSATTNTTSRSHSEDIATDHLNIPLRNKPIRDLATSQEDCTFVKEDKLRAIIQEEFCSALKNNIKDLIRAELKITNDKIDSFQDAINFINAQYEEMKNSLQEKSTIISALKTENEKLKKDVKELGNRLNIMELHSRDSNIEINGLPENRSENLTNTLNQLAKIVNYSLVTEDIQHVTRVAKLSRESNRPRAVIVKLRSPRQRDAFLTAVMKFNKANVDKKLGSHHLGIGGTHSPVFVTEHLTPENKSLHAATRKKAKELCYKFVWIRNGRIYVRKDENCQALQIKSTDTLSLLN
ncbi:PREDICTED: uncharacterized protein LOC106110614 [Papilio polytes]|uniref:uncharacterized protein LOC106110614 n=1 Tax=Papilio polytes TaxID=76194 RepID=UPI000675D88B|nr:PREDICTED: uncharacterized protein LOC106110614 [Papilio polytes]